MCNELGDKAFHHVWNSLSILLRYIQVIHPCWISRRIFSRGSAIRCCALYSDGVCMESFNQRRCSLHVGASSGQRFNNIGCFCSYRCLSVGCRWRFYPVGHAYTLGRTVCCHSTFCRNSNPCNGYPAKRNRLFQYRLCPQVR